MDVCWSGMTIYTYNFNFLIYNLQSTLPLFITVFILTGKEDEVVTALLFII